MADAVSHTSKPENLAPQLPSDHANPGKFVTHFLYKAALVTVFLVLLPFFPSLAPDYINQTLHARSWELLQLIFVGIAVSYGLFSKKNDEAEKDNSAKLDNAQSYVSKLLQVSSVFDDESENQTVVDENKVQTWSSQYYRGEPVVVVAKESPVVKQENGVSSEISQKPLLLPVRSLKQRVSEQNQADLGDESGRTNGSIARSSSSSGSKRYTSSSRKPRNVELGGLNVQILEEKLEENVVLPSPIPWRSRSGRMEMKENEDGTLSPSVEEPELSRLESRSVRPSRPNSSSKNLSPSPSLPTPQKPSPSTSFSSESQAKSREDAVRKKNFSSPPPAPPPPPPPPFLRKSLLTKSNSTVTSNVAASEKILRRSVRSVPTEQLSESETEEPWRSMNLGAEFRGSMQNDGKGKSIRTFRPNELVLGTEKQSIDYQTKFVEKKGYVDATESYVKSPKEERNGLVENVLMETSDEESEVETEDDYFDGSSGNGEAATDNNVNDVGPDVDKKADEFIAKFREQIRLQRIESIRRSTAQRSGKTLR
ncbi:hypothetical protein Salat_0649900 [Sesamum alatum]|uniref:Hydroxyproline-rich glycoprotein family protein n=1 Tax=Sesamum alatum TaxID=300844 RepID=A0AAE2CUE3_9LAMI|nr:hypothetical protein Salat_0649900 [Sesamum alatum]